MDRLALLVSEGMRLCDAGEMMGLTRGQTSRCWQRIKQELGEQAR